MSLPSGFKEAAWNWLPWNTEEKWNEYRLMLPIADFVSVTEHLVKKYFPTFQAVFLERNVCLDQENAPDKWVDNMGI